MPHTSSRTPNSVFKVILGLILTLSLLMPALPQHVSAAQTPDVNGDCTIDSADVDALTAHYGTSSDTGDINSDGVVNIYDLSLVLSSAGQTMSNCIPATGDKLLWAPPTLSTSTTLNIPTGDAEYDAHLDTTKDYTLKLPPVTRGPVYIFGGHNVVVIGGHLHMSSANITARIMYINGSTGTVHVEGVLMDRDEGVEADAIAISAPNATVQLENIRAPGVRGDYSGVHGDIVQPWGGVQNLRIDHLTGSSNYQGLFLRPDLGHLGTLDLNNIDMSYDDYTPVGGGYLVWLTTDGGGTYGETADEIDFSNVYVSRVRAASGFGHSIWPQVGATKGAVITNNQATWPSLPAVSGSVTYGTPSSGGEYVPDGVAGLNYASPGYK